MKLRLFFAVNFNEAVREKLFYISSQLQKFDEPIKFERIDKLHLTLLFLGNVDEMLLPDLQFKVSEISHKYNQTKLMFDKLGVFKNYNQPRVIWIGTKENQILRELSLDLKRITNQLGIQTDEKEFSPHITLGRVKGKLSECCVNFLKTYSFEPFESDVKTFELMESKLEPSGSKYSIKYSFYLIEK